MPDPDFEQRLWRKLGAMQSSNDARFDALTTQQATILEALQGENGGLKPGGEPGLLVRQDKTEAGLEAAQKEIVDLKASLKKLQDAVDAIQATPGKLALGWLSKVILALTVPGAVYLAALAVSQFGSQMPKGGTHP